MMPSENDDDWAELARELAREQPPPSATEQAPSADSAGSSDEAASSDSATYELSETVAGGAESGLDGGEVQGPDEQPGTGRKRRRRRRRRRRGGPEEAAEAGASDTGDTESDAAEAGESEPVGGDSESSEGGYSDESEEEHDTELVSNQSEVDEDAGGELLRDLIANWNVPSWDDVVGGLYRPER